MASMRESYSDGFDRAVRLPRLMMHCRQGLFEARQYIAERIDHQRLALLDNLDQIVIAHGADDNRQLAAALDAAIDFVDYRMGFFQAVDKRDGVCLEGVIRKLGQQAVPKGFGGDRGAVGEKIYLAGICLH